MVVKGKKIGAKFESNIISSLRDLGYFIYRKGVSTKGIDVLAFKENIVIQLELKSLSKLINSNFNSSLKQYLENRSYVIDFYDRFAKYHNINMQYFLIIYDRFNNKFVVVNGRDIVVEHDLENKNIIYNFSKLYNRLICDEFKFII